MDKQFILGNVARLQVEDIFEAIQTGVVTFEELKDTGKFMFDKQESVSKMLDEANAGQHEEDEAWEQAKATDTVNSYQAYLQTYPVGRYVNNAQNKIHLKQQSKQHEKQGVLDDIKMRPTDYPRHSIENLLNNHTLTENDLIESGIITREGLDLFLSDPVFLDEQFGWGDLSELAANKTDIYFFGIPASGKSCLLAGLLHYLWQNAFLKLERDNQLGSRYADALLSLIQGNNLGFVPPATTEEGVNYIEADIRGGEVGKQQMHPVNILEMSGELFRNTYKHGTTEASVARTIGANSFLRNNNRKVIFLVVDYKKTVTPGATQSMARQALQLEAVLSMLAKDGTLSKTDALHIVLTKSDLLPGGIENTQAAENFIETEYKNLRQTIREYRDDYGFRDSRIIPFSVGRFMLKDIFEYDPRSSQSIYQAILASTFIKPKTKRFKLW